MIIWISRWITQKNGVQWGAHLRPGQNENGYEIAEETRQRHGDQEDAADGELEYGQIHFQVRLLCKRSDEGRA